MRRSALPKHLAQVPSQIVGAFERSKMAAFVMVGLEHELPHHVRPPSEKTLVSAAAKQIERGQTHDFGSCSSSRAKYDTPTGTGIHFVPAFVSRVPPAVIS